MKIVCRKKTVASWTIVIESHHGLFFFQCVLITPASAPWCPDEMSVRLQSRRPSGFPGSDFGGEGDLLLVLFFPRQGKALPTMEAAPLSSFRH